MSENSFGDSFSEASCHENDQPPEFRSCHTAILGVITILKIVKREQETYWKICHSCSWKYELQFLSFNSSWKKCRAYLSLWELETYDASTISGPIFNSAKFVTVVYHDKRLWNAAEYLKRNNFWVAVASQGRRILTAFFLLLLSNLKFVCLQQWQVSRTENGIFFLALHLKTSAFYLFI